MQKLEYKILKWDDFIDYLQARGLRYQECFHLEYKYGLDLSKEKEQLINEATHVILEGTEFPVNLRHLRELFFEAIADPTDNIPEMGENDFAEYNAYMLQIRKEFEKIMGAE